MEKVRLKLSDQNVGLIFILGEIAELHHLSELEFGQDYCLVMRDGLSVGIYLESAQQLPGGVSLGYRPLEGAPQLSFLMVAPGDLSYATLHGANVVRPHGSLDDVARFPGPSALLSQPSVVDEHGGSDQPGPLRRPALR